MKRNELQGFNCSDKTKCPICEHQLKKRYEGMVCKNPWCPLYFKCEKGWVYYNNEKKQSLLFWTAKYDFDITRHENIKKWLMLKSKIIYERKCCEVCGSIKLLQVHHILPRSSNPELALDIENLMLLCKDCHKKIHSEDKYNFGEKK